MTWALPNIGQIMFQLNYTLNKYGNKWESYFASYQIITGYASFLFHSEWERYFFIFLASYKPCKRTEKSFNCLIFVIWTPLKRVPSLSFSSHNLTVPHYCTKNYFLEVSCYFMFLSLLTMLTFSRRNFIIFTCRTPLLIILNFEYYNLLISRKLF